MYYRQTVYESLFDRLDTNAHAADDGLAAAARMLPAATGDMIIHLDQGFPGAATLRA